MVKIGKSRRPKQKRTSDKVRLRTPRVVEGILAGETDTSIAGALQIHPRVVREMRSHPDVRAAVDAACKERESAVRQQLAALKPIALKTLYTAMSGGFKSQTASDAIRAAENILDRGGNPRLTHVEQSGVVGQVNVSAPANSDFDGRSGDDLLHYANHGHWPEECPDGPSIPVGTPTNGQHGAAKPS